MSNNMFYPTINHVTRKIATSASLIDNIYTNTNLNFKYDVTKSNITDQYSIFCILNNSMQNKMNETSGALLKYCSTIV